MSIKYDVIIAGGGVAGAFAAYRISKSKDLRACLIEFGRPPGKRRKQLEGWLGCFPTGNARLYLDDIDGLEKLVGARRYANAREDVLKFLCKYAPVKGVKIRKPLETAKFRAASVGYEIAYREYAQWKPENIHALSKDLAEWIECANKTDMVFDNEIKSISKKGDYFTVETEEGTFISRKVILCLGRSGWRFTKSTLTQLGLAESDDYASFGFKAEIPVSCMKDWNGSHCSLSKGNIKIGPLSWNGTVIPEDHVDLVVASWRSNEDRWASEKVAFSVLAREKFSKQGSYQTERLGKLAFVLSDNRVGRLRVTEYLNGDVDLSLIPEYNWMSGQLREINTLFPGFTTKGAIHVPDISLVLPKTKVKSNLGTEMSGLYVAGESAGLTGLMNACITGYIAGESACKDK